MTLLYTRQGIETTMAEASKQASQETRWSEYPHLAWRGAAMGIAEVIPGVSGGTIALITGILGRMVDAIHSINIKALRLAVSFKIRELFDHVHWRFLLMLFSGQVLGIVLCTRIIPLPKLLDKHPEPVLGLFFGLIIGSIVLLARDSGRPGAWGALCYLVGAVAGACVVAGVRTDTPNAPWFIFLCGAIAICAWILPGVSGSFVLLLLRKYNYVWSGMTLNNEHSLSWNLFNVAIPFGLGAIVGLMSFSRILSWVMHRYPKQATMAMNGLLIASLYAIYPFQHRTFEEMASGKTKLVSTKPFIPSMEEISTTSGMLAVVLAIIGCFLVLWIDRLARNKKTGISK